MFDRGPWIQTATGKHFHLLDPQPDDVCIADVAHALSNICRFNGYCSRFYSVAEHSVLVSRAVPREYALHALLHDAAEAYIGDLSRPFKAIPIVRDTVKAVEARVMAAVYAHLRLAPPDERGLKAVKEADDAMLMTEAEVLMGSLEGWESYSPHKMPLEWVRCLPPRDAMTEFLAEFVKLARP